MIRNWRLVSRFAVGSSHGSYLSVTPRSRWRFSSVWLNQRNSYEGRKFEIRISNPETNSNLETLNADPENAKPYDLEERTVVFAELSRALSKDCRERSAISRMQDNLFGRRGL